MSLWQHSFIHIDPWHCLRMLSIFNNKYVLSSTLSAKSSTKRTRYVSVSSKCLHVLSLDTNLAHLPSHLQPSHKVLKVVQYSILQAQSEVILLISQQVALAFRFNLFNCILHLHMTLQHSFALEEIDNLFIDDQMCFTTQEQLINININKVPISWHANKIFMRRKINSLFSAATLCTCFHK